MYTLADRERDMRAAIEYAAGFLALVKKTTGEGRLALPDGHFIYKEKLPTFRSDPDAAVLRNAVGEVKKWAAIYADPPKRLSAFTPPPDASPAVPVGKTVWDLEGRKSSAPQWDHGAMWISTAESLLGLVQNAAQLAANEFSLSLKDKPWFHGKPT